MTRGNPWCVECGRHRAAHDDVQHRWRRPEGEEVERLRTLLLRGVASAVEFDEQIAEVFTLSPAARRLVLN